MRQGDQPSLTRTLVSSEATFIWLCWEHPGVLLCLPRGLSTSHFSSWMSRIVKCLHFLAMDMKRYPLLRNGYTYTFQVCVFVCECSSWGLVPNGVLHSMTSSLENTLFWCELLASPYHDLFEQAAPSPCLLGHSFPCGSKFRTGQPMWTTKLVKASLNGSAVHKKPMVKLFFKTHKYIWNTPEGPWAHF